MMPLRAWVCFAFFGGLLVGAVPLSVVMLHDAEADAKAQAAASAKAATELGEALSDKKEALEIGEEWQGLALECIERLKACTGAGDGP